MIKCNEGHYHNPLFFVLYFSFQKSLYLILEIVSMLLNAILQFFGIIFRQIILQEIKKVNEKLSFLLNNN